MKILIIEDEPTNAVLLKRVLEQMGHSTVIAESGISAGDLIFGPSSFDVVFLDWNLPDASGVEFTSLVRSKLKSDHQPYIVMMTYTSDPALIQLAFDSGVDEYLPKPLTVAQIWARIHSAERSASLNRALFAGQHPDVRHLMCELAKDWFKRAIHEVSTPLSVITLSAEILSAKARPGLDATEYCEKICRNSELIRGILMEQLNHLTQGASEKRVLNLKELVEQGLKQISLLAQASQVDINFNAPTFTPAINGNPTELLQLFFNLVTNGLDASASTPRRSLNIRITEEPPHIKLHVRNSDSNNQNLDGKLIRSAGRMVSEKGGTHQGLGLRICRQIAEEHGGHIAANVGSGYTEFVVFLPKSTATA